jgi:hypothetical protein
MLTWLGQETLTKTLLQQKSPALNRKKSLVLMKRKALELTVIVALLSSLMAVTMPVNLVTANPGYLVGFPLKPFKTLPSIVVHSPIRNETYYSPHLLLNFTVFKPDSWFNPLSNGYDYAYGNLSSVYYVVDDAGPQNITVNDPYPSNGWLSNTLPPSNFTFSLTLNLTAGVHSIEIGVEANSYYLGPGWIPLSHIVLQAKSGSINFTVVLPKLTIVTPERITYNETSIPLVFSTKQAASWIGYGLDGKDNVTITGNTTLTGLSNGEHNVTVYANDTFGNIGASETVNFTVAVPEPFPAVPVAAASGASVAVVGVGLQVYFKKRKH